MLSCVLSPRLSAQPRTGHSTKSSHGGADAHSTGEVVHHTRRVLRLRARGRSFGKSGPRGRSHAPVAHIIAKPALGWPCQFQQLCLEARHMSAYSWTSSSFLVFRGNTLFLHMSDGHRIINARLKFNHNLAAFPKPHVSNTHHPSRRLHHSWNPPYPECLENPTPLESRTSQARIWNP